MGSGLETSNTEIFGPAMEATVLQHEEKELCEDMEGSEKRNSWGKGGKLELIAMTKRRDLTSAGGAVVGGDVVGVVDARGVGDGGRNRGKLGAASGCIGGLATLTKTGAMLGLRGTWQSPTFRLWHWPLALVASPQAAEVG